MVNYFTIWKVCQSTQRVLVYRRAKVIFMLQLNPAGRLLKAKYTSFSFIFIAFRIPVVLVKLALSKKSRT